MPQKFIRRGQKNAAVEELRSICREGFWDKEGSLMIA
jgi:hypothetical protein